MDPRVVEVRCWHVTFRDRVGTITIISHRGLERWLIIPRALGTKLLGSLLMCCLT